MVKKNLLLVFMVKKNEAKKIGHKAGLNLISQAGDGYKVNK